MRSRRAGAATRRATAFVKAVQNNRTNKCKQSNGSTRHSAKHKTKLTKGKSKMKDIAIKENHLYQKAYRSGERANAKHVSVYVLRDWSAKNQMLQNPEKKYINRIGLSVSKKIGRAVVRNRAKRIIRAGLSEARKYGNLKTGYLIVIAARVGVHEASSKDIALELISAFKKLNMYKEAHKTNEEAAK